MYAIIEVGSNQYKVSEGDVIETNRLPLEVGKDFAIEKVLFFANGEDIRIGQPVLKNVKVTARITGHPLDDKKISFKYRRRKESASKVGHRQKLTGLNITKITAE